MGKTLVIAEKPSVATDIAKTLGGLKKVTDYYEGDEYIVASLQSVIYWRSRLLKSMKSNEENGVLRIFL